MGSSPNRRLIPMVRLKSPGHRYSEVLEFINKPGFSNSKTKIYPDGFTDHQVRLIDICKDPDKYGEDDPCRMAHLLYSVPTACSILKGLFIAGASLEEVAEIVEVDVDTLDAFKNIFFDTKVFKNRLLTIAYIRSLVSDTEADKFNKQLLSWGYYLGSDYIAWKIGSPDKVLSTKSPMDAVSEVLRDASWRSKEHFMSELTDSQTREARAWVPQVLKSAETLHDMNDARGMENSLSGLKIKIESIDNTKRLEDLEGTIKS